MIAPARRAALDVLQAVESRRADLPAAIADARQSLADERDRSLLVELVTGTVRWQGQLDLVIGHAARRPLSRLDPVVLAILRLGVYQLLHLDRVPAAAVVDDAVQMTRGARKTSAAGFVNAVLRTVSRTRRALPLPPRPALLPGGAPANREAALDYLSGTLSHPRWLVTRWLDRHGFAATEAWARFNNEPAALTLRANTLRIGRTALASRLVSHGVTARETAYAPDGLVVTAGNPLRTPLADEGVFVVQEEASQLVALLARAGPGERVIDTCASPGGKTLAMAAAMNGKGLLVAADVRSRRVDLLRRTLSQAGLSIPIIRLDLLAPLPFPAVFDCVFVDAPCSGLGIIRRDPEIRWRRTADDLVGLAAAQRRMLDHAARIVRPGGRLVYATCSSEPEENEAVVGEFVHQHRDFVPVEHAEVVAALPAAAAGLVGRSAEFRTWPWRDGLEAFFGVRLRRLPGAPRRDDHP